MPVPLPDPEPERDEALRATDVYSQLVKHGRTGNFGVVCTLLDAYIGEAPGLHSSYLATVGPLVTATAMAAPGVTFPLDGLWAQLQRDTATAGPEHRAACEAISMHLRCAPEDVDMKALLDTQDELVRCGGLASVLAMVLATIRIHAELQQASPM